MASRKPKTLEQVFAEEAGDNPPPDWEKYEFGTGKQNASASIGHWHNFGAAGPFVSPDVLQEQIDANKAAIEFNRVLIDQDRADLDQDRQILIAQKDLIAADAYEISLLDGRISDIEEFLGGVDVTIPLGTGRWIFDFPMPPASSYFTAFSSYFNSSNTEFWFNRWDKLGSTLQWSKARVGDRLFVYQTEDKYGDFRITEFNYEDGDVYHFKVDFITGEGQMKYGGQYEASVTRETQSFTPPAFQRVWSADG